MEELKDCDLMNIYEIYDRLLDLACATNDKEEEWILRNASRMLGEIEVFTTKLNDFTQVKEALEEIIYPLR